LTTAAATPGSGTWTCYLLRHGEAGRRAAWEGPDERRPLTAEGQAQAAGLVGQLSQARIIRVRSSSFARCVGTVQPIAEARGLPIELAPALEEGAPVAGALSLICGPQSAGALLCSHGDVIDGVIGHLVAGGVPLNAAQGTTWAALETPKGATWVFDLAGGRVTAGTLLPPP
jgi:8-oxo-dGTP diphosphatase